MSFGKTLAAGPPYGKQPWFAIYLTYQVVTTFLLRVPLWVLYFALPRNRPKATWTLKRAFMLRLVKHAMHVSYMAGPLARAPSYLAIEDGPNVKAVWIAPAPHLIVGKLKEWATTASVECIKIPGYWLHKLGDDHAPGAPARPGERVLLALHGGGYILNSAHPSDISSNVPSGIIAATPSITRALSIEYRLTRLPPLQPTNPFPAALVDALAGYNYLVNELRFDPANIVVVGNSAGANLALALIQYLVDHQTFPDVIIPVPPAALILCSPWVDLSVLGHDIGGSIHTNKSTDYLDVTTGFMEHITTTFTEFLGPSAVETNCYISPASISPQLETVSYKGFPRTSILSGGSEVFRDQIRTLKEKMTLDLGGDVAYMELPDGVHDFLVFTWFEPERSEALDAIRLWLKLE